MDNRNDDDRSDHGNAYKEYIQHGGFSLMELIIIQNHRLRKLVLLIAAGLLLLPLAAWAVTHSFTITVTTTFTPLHTYFIAATGCNDANAGTSAGSPWCTPNHAVVCGDVIIAASGNYTTDPFGQTNWGTVSTCPSLSGGIDGSGGVYFAVLLCGGSDVMSCTINSGGDAVWVSKSNWAIEGFWATTPINSSNCFIGDNGNTGGTPLHHLAFINDIASTCGDSGFATSNGASATGSFDQTAVVGAIVYNAANSQNNGNECGSGISIVPANGPDTSAGTHVYLAGIYASHNSNTGTPPSPGCSVGGGHSDGEGIILDTWGAGATSNGYLYQGVIEQTLIWNSGGSGIQIFPTLAFGGTPLPSWDKAQYFISDTTIYASNQDGTTGTQCKADLHLHGISPNSSPTTSSIYDIRNNIIQATVVFCGGNAALSPVWAANIDLPGLAGEANIANPPVNIDGNYIFNSHVPTTNGYSNTNNNVYFDPTNGGRSATFTLGTNTYVDPGLASPTTLLATAPDCTGYENVTLCMINKYDVLTKVTPSVAPTTMGYQKPITGCSTKVLSNGTNAFPSWLKGIVYLHWTGSIVQQRAGLITMPCGL